MGDRITLDLVNSQHSKRYQLWTEQHANGYTVHFAYGAIGSPLKEGTKTPTPGKPCSGHQDAGEAAQGKDPGTLPLLWRCIRSD